MHSHSLDQWTHEHVFLGEKHEHNERRTWFVVALTAVMMIGEIAAGSDLLCRGHRGGIARPLRQPCQRLAAA